MIPHVTNMDDVRRGLIRVTHQGLEDISEDLIWEADSVTPDIGDGTLTAYRVHSLQWVMLTIRLLIGSTTTFGTGNWYFVPPESALYSTPSICGGGWAFDDSAGAILTVVPTLLAVNQIYIIESSGGIINSGAPFTWAQDDILNFTIYYPLKG